MNEQAEPRTCTVPWHAHTNDERLPTCRYEDEPESNEEQQ